MITQTEARPVSFPWGSSTLEFDLPKNWRVLGELKPKELLEPKNLNEACLQALAKPIESQRLADRDLRGKRVLVVVDDHTRPTPVAEFLPGILAELEKAGCDDDAISFLLANGVHRPSDRDEVEAKLGKETTGRFRWKCHDAYDPEGLADLGTTSRATPVKLNRALLEADLIVIAGAVEPHLLLGFGGGLKMIIPGCASAETIAANHMQGVEPGRFDFVGAAAEDSPMRMDLEEGALMSGKEFFIINAALNNKGRPAAFFCGHPVHAHRKAQDFVSQANGIDVGEQADIVLANSFPGDGDLRQSIKCVGNSLFACKPKGLLLGTVYCKEGLGEIPIPKVTLPYPALRLLVRAIGKKRILKLVQRIKRGEPEEEIFVGNFGLQMLRRNNLGLFSEHLKAEYGKKLGLAMVFNQTKSWLDWARKKAPKNASVWIFPNGGVTFARFKG